MLFSLPVVSDSLRPHGLQHSRPPCPSPSPKLCPSSCPLPQWCHPAIWSSDALFSFCPQSFPESGTFPISQLFASDDQNIGASASVLLMSIQGSFPLILTGLISLLSKGLWGVFPSTTVQRNGKPPQYTCHENLINYIKCKKICTERWVSQVGRCPVCYWGWTEDNILMCIHKK